MGSVEERAKSAGLISGAHSIIEDIKVLKEMHQDHSGLFYFAINFCVMHMLLVINFVNHLAAHNFRKVC